MESIIDKNSEQGVHGGCGCGGDKICCKIFTVALAKTLSEGTDILISITQEAAKNPPPNFTARALNVQFFYIEAKHLVEKAFKSAQGKGCNKDCCVELAHGIKTGTLAIIKVAVSNAYSAAPGPQFTLEQVATNIDAALAELEGFLCTELSFAGCKWKSCGCKSKCKC